ncbi:MAG: ATP-binding protein [Pseudomonadales bacterium]|nr:ATP-binding protein [Pseudomonadales bacterium]
MKSLTNNKYSRLRTAALSLAALLAALLPIGTSQAQEEKQALILYSSTDIGAWEQSFNAVLTRHLSRIDNIYATPVFLSLVNSDEASNQRKAQSLQMQFEAQEIDLLISIFPEAGHFIRNYSDIIAPRARRFYVLPDDTILESLEPQREFALASSVETATGETLALMQRLLPDLEQLYLVGGSGAGDLAYMSRIVDSVESSAVSAEVTVLQGLTPDQLVRELESSQTRNSAIVLSTYDTDNSGQAQRTISINSLLQGQTNIPVFSMFDSQIGRGAVGGNMSVAEGYAEATFDITQQYLADAEPPLISFAPTQYMFDGGRLNHFGISRNLLPEDSIILNDPPNYWRENFWWIGATSLVIVVQLALITLLLQAISRRKQAEEELKTTQKMEALGSLAGGIAHDFNNILMAIMANAELAKATLNQPEQANTRLSNIISASNRAKGLISQILMFSRQSATRNSEKLDLAALIEESAGQIRAFLPRECQLELAIDRNLNAIDGDENQLQQAIMNICINAQHAMNNEGVIRIAARDQHLAADSKIGGQEVTPGAYVSIAISDTGQGIKASQLSRLFEPFYTTKPQGKGTGLGLALVYRIVRAHNGYIDVQSEPGEGSIFTIYLPASEQSAAIATCNDAPEPVRGSGARILLVDDDDMVLDANLRILEKLNYQVDAFRSSTEALKAARSEPDKWDLLFTDLSMPEMDGVRLATQIRQFRSDIPVILYTGYLDAVDSIDIENLRILGKPSPMDEIAQTVAQALKQESPVPG